MFAFLKNNRGSHLLAILDDMPGSYGRDPDQQEREWSDSLDQTSRRKESARVQVQGFGQSTAQKAVWANKKAVAKSAEGAIMGSGKKGSGGVKEGGKLFGTPDFSTMHTNGLKKSVRSFEKVIAEHEKKLADPESFYPEWRTISERDRQGTIKFWKKEIANYQRQLEAARQELMKRS